MTLNAQLANRKLITIVLYESGGVISKVHTEDIAIKAHEMFPDRLCQVNIARTGFASDEIATQTFDLDTRRLTPDPEATFA